jgi:hypothetical protein
LGKWECIVLPGLGSQESFGGRAVTLTLSIFFESKLDRYRLVHEELPVHGLNSRICGFEVRVGHKSVTLRQTCLRIARDLIGWGCES